MAEHLAVPKCRCPLKRSATVTRPRGSQRGSRRQSSYRRSRWRVNFVVGVRSHTGDVLSVYLIDADIEKLIEFLNRKND
jgi:hypothetical protein